MPTFTKHLYKLMDSMSLYFFMRAICGDKYIPITNIALKPLVSKFIDVEVLNSTTNNLIELPTKEN